MEDEKLQILQDMHQVEKQIQRNETLLQQLREERNECESLCVRLKQVIRREQDRTSRSNNLLKQIGQTPNMLMATAFANQFAAENDDERKSMMNGLDQAVMVAEKRISEVNSQISGVQRTLNSLYCEMDLLTDKRKSLVGGESS